MRKLLFALALLIAAPAAAQTAHPLPDWMSGYWLSCENGEQVAENWFGAGTDTMLGTNLTRGAHGVSYEFLRIGPSVAGFSYFSMPNGQSPPTEFALKEQSAERVVFENATHDFPQRILYWREGSTLHARIEGTIDGREENAQWRFRRANTNSRCR